MPVFNTEKYVKEALDSIFSQTYKNFEVICIDDGSTDNSLSILESFGDKIIFIKSINCGASESRNKGLRVAKGEYIAFLDADDLWVNNKLELQIKKLEENPDLDILFTNMQCFISPELSEEVKKLRYCPPEIMAGYIPSSVILSKSLFEKVGYFDSRFKNGQFVDWLERAKYMGLKVGLIPEFLLLRRIHETNIGVRERADSNKDYLRIIKESLERKRKNNL